MTIQDPRPKKPNPDSMTYLHRAKPLSPLSELLPQVLQHNQPGASERPARDPAADPQCPACKGWGWRQGTTYKNRWFICSCVVKAEHSFLVSRQPQIDHGMIGLTEKELNELGWNNLIDDVSISDGGRMLEPAKFLFNRGHGVLFVWGSFGQGKTLLGKIMAALGYQQGKRTAYANLAAVMDNLRASFDEQHQSAELLRRMDWWIQRDILVLDELGRTNMTEWTAERVFMLLDARYTRAIREEALTVIISNKKDGGMDGYMTSRIKDLRLWIPIDGKDAPPVIHVEGKDGRQAMPKQYQF